MKIPKSVKLVEKSIDACLSAIEIYNKPNFLYREEAFSVLMLNAWELLLKARILQENKNSIRSIEVWERITKKNGKPGKRLAPKKNRAGNNLTIDLIRAANTVRSYARNNIDALCGENLRLLMDIRDNAIHFINPSRGLSARVQEIGTAAIRNYARACRDWFGKDLGRYNFYLMPLAFESAAGVIETAFSSEKNIAMANLAKLITDREAAFPFDPAKQFNVAVRLDIQFMKKAGAQAITVRVDRDDPTAIPVAITAEEGLGLYPWRTVDLYDHLRKRYKDFKQNQKFFQLLKPLKSNRGYCDTRFLDPGNPRSAQQNRYNPNIVKEFDPYYARA